MRALTLGLVASLLGCSSGGFPSTTSATSTTGTTGRRTYTNGVPDSTTGSSGTDSTSGTTGSTDSTSGSGGAVTNTTGTSTTGTSASATSSATSTAGTTGTTGTTGTSASLRVAEWNIEFFGKADAGPTDDALQTANVGAVVGPIAPDVMAFEEVCDTADFAAVVSGLHAQFGLDYTAIVANDPSLANAYANYGGTWGQKTALLFQSSVATRVSAQLVFRSDIDPSWGSTFSSRTPLEVQLQLTGTGTRVYFLVVHLKAGSDQASYDQRVKASQDIKTYLDLVHPNDAVMVLGDWNDDLDTSIFQASASPFANFVSDAAHYAFATQPFSAANTSTTADHSGHPIDHHLINARLFGDLRAGSAQIIKPTLPNYATTTSDHYPTVVDYDLP